MRLNDVLVKQLSIINKHYPDMDITQLGLTVLILGALRSMMGHEHDQGTLESYINQQGLSDGVKKCVDYIQREFLGTHKSKIDIDLWKRGKKVSVKYE